VSGPALVGEIVDSRTSEQWAEVVRADLGMAVAGFISAGRHLDQARTALGWRRGGDGYRAWCREKVGINEDTAAMLIKISEYYQPLQDQSPTMVGLLPPSWRTLYELSKMDRPLLEAAINARHVHPELERKAAIGIVADYKKAAAIEAARSVQPGQWWQLGEHLLYCGDSASEEFVSRAEGQFVFADPPYNAGKADWDEAFKWRHDYLIDAAPIVAVTPGISAIAGFFADTQMPYRWSIAAWISNGMTRGALGFSNWIYVALFSHEESLHANAQDHMKIAISPSAPSTRHEARKPAELLVNLLETFTDDGGTVVDPFLGSGTTLFAADQTGRRCVGAEIRPEFCAEILARYAADPDAEVRLA